MTQKQKKILLNVLQQYKLSGIQYMDDVDLSILDTDSKKLPNSFQHLEEIVSNCTLCDFSKQKIACDFGMGNYSSEIFIIGTNKSQLSDKLVFEMFQNMIEKVLLINLDDIFLTHIIKCTVSKLPKETKEEENICIDYLKKQISIAKPKLIITLGEAFNKLLEKNENIIDISGNLHRFNNIKTIPLLHPEFIYKNPSYKAQTFNDLKKIKLILEKI